MSSGVQLHAGKDQHLATFIQKRYRLPMCYLFKNLMIMTLIFYYHMKVNGHEILILKNVVKLSRILLRWFRSICFISGFHGMAITHHLDPLSGISVHL